MASYVVTGGGRGVGRAIVERLAADRDTVAVIEFDAAALDWAATHPAAPRIVPVIRRKFVNGVILPIDGGRAAQGRDPEEA